MRAVVAASAVLALMLFAASAVAAEPILGHNVHRHHGKRAERELVERHGPFNRDGVRVDMPPVRLPRHESVDANGRLGYDAAATVLLHESLFKKLVASVLPAVIADARKLTIPGEHEKHFSFDPIRLSKFDIGSFTIGFAAPNKVVVSLENLVLEVPDTHFDVYAKILFFKASCGGDFSVAIGEAGKTPTSIVIEFDMSDENGHLVISNGVANVHFGYLNVYHHFHSFVCRVGQDIIQLFVGNIDKLIRNLVEKEATPIATKAINKIFSEMAAKVHIPLAAQPVATSESIQLSFNLLPDQSLRSGRRLHGALAAVAGSKRQLRVKGDFPARDIEVFVTQDTVNSLFNHFWSIGHLNIHDTLSINTTIFEKLLPAAYNACPACPLQLTATFQQAPWATFDGSASAGFDKLVAGFSAVASNGTALPLIDLSLNGTFTAMNWTVSGADENTIDFKIAIPTFTMSLYRSTIGPVDVSLLQDLVDFVLKDVAVPDFNKKFKGIAIPPIANVTVEDLEVSFNAAADAGLNIVVPTF